MFLFSESSVEYYHGNKSIPVYEHPKKGYSGEQIAKVLCNPILDEKFICCTHPVSVENNVCFVVDLSTLNNVCFVVDLSTLNNVCFVVDFSTLKDHNDIHADDLGADHTKRAAV